LAWELGLHADAPADGAAGAPVAPFTMARLARMPSMEELVASVRPPSTSSLASSQSSSGGGAARGAGGIAVPALPSSQPQPSPLSQSAASCECMIDLGVDSSDDEVGEKVEDGAEAKAGAAAGARQGSGVGVSAPLSLPPAPALTPTSQASSADLRQALLQLQRSYEARDTALRELIRKAAADEQAQVGAMVAARRAQVQARKAELNRRRRLMGHKVDEDGGEDGDGADDGFLADEEAEAQSMLLASHLPGLLRDMVGIAGGLVMASSPGALRRQASSGGGGGGDAAYAAGLSAMITELLRESAVAQQRMRGGAVVPMDSLTASVRARQGLFTQLRAAHRRQAADLHAKSRGFTNMVQVGVHRTRQRLRMQYTELAAQLQLAYERAVAAEGATPFPIAVTLSQPAAADHDDGEARFDDGDDDDAAGEHIATGSAPVPQVESAPSTAEQSAAAAVGSLPATTVTRGKTYGQGRSAAAAKAEAVAPALGALAAAAGVSATMLDAEPATSTPVATAPEVAGPATHSPAPPAPAGPAVASPRQAEVVHASDDDGDDSSVDEDDEEAVIAQLMRRQVQADEEEENASDDDDDDEQEEGQREGEGHAGGTVSVGKRLRTGVAAHRSASPQPPRPSTPEDGGAAEHAHGHVAGPRAAPALIADEDDAEGMTAVHAAAQARRAELAAVLAAPASSDAAASERAAGPKKPRKGLTYLQMLQAEAAAGIRDPAVSTLCEGGVGRGGGGLATAAAERVVCIGHQPPPSLIPAHAGGGTWPDRRRGGAGGGGGGRCGHGRHRRGADAARPRRQAGQRESTVDGRAGGQRRGGGGGHPRRQCATPPGGIPPAVCPACAAPRGGAGGAGGAGDERADRC
jgi:hypothetical protein